MGGYFVINYLGMMINYLDMMINYLGTMINYLGMMINYLGRMINYMVMMINYLGILGHDDQLLGRAGKLMLRHLATHITPPCRLCAPQLHSFTPLVRPYYSCWPSTFFLSCTVVKSMFAVHGAHLALQSSSMHCIGGLRFIAYIPAA